MMMFPLLIGVLANVPLPQAAEIQTPRPSSETIEAWKSHLLPRPSELLYEEIPWLAKFGEGVLAASDQGKPLLFWAMNGHPLGCT